MKSPQGRRGGPYLVQGQGGTDEQDQDLRRRTRRKAHRLITRRVGELCDQPVGAFTYSRSQRTSCPTIS